VFVHVNPTVMTVTAGNLDPYGKTWWSRGLARYDRASVTWTVGVIPLMALTITPATTDSVNFEINYWLGNEFGGEYPYLPPLRKIVVPIAAGAPKCIADTGCWWAVPEFNYSDFPERVHGGDKSQKYFTVGRMHDGGVTQTVAVTPGAWYRFTAWVQGWQCYDWLACCDKRPSCVSDEPAEMNLQVGIAVTDSVTWGAAGESFDHWTQFSAVAQAVTDTLTVWTRSRVRFDYARENNDVYLDDARLEAVRMLWIPLVEVAREN